ncbi:MAG: hypothetical protein ACR2NR_03895 [Solirubrobacteraceae bacterium]
MTTVPSPSGTTRDADVAITGNEQHYLQNNTAESTLVPASLREPVAQS